MISPIFLTRAYTMKQTLPFTRFFPFSVNAKLAPSLIYRGATARPGHLRGPFSTGEAFIKALVRGDSPDPQLTRVATRPNRPDPRPTWRGSWWMGQFPVWHGRVVTPV